MIPARALSGFLDGWRREARHLRDTPSELVLMTAFPCVLLALLAWLLSPAVIRDLPIAVVDQDRSTLSRELIHRLEASPGLRVVAVPGDVREAWSQVRRMDAYAVVLIPPLTSRRLYHDGPARVLVYYNASYLTSGQGASRDVAAVVGELNARILERDIARMRSAAAAGSAPIAVQATTLANPQHSFEHFLLALLFPGVLHLMASLGMIGALGRELRDGSLRAWLASSPHPVAGMAGKLALYVVLYWLLTCASLGYLAFVGGSGIAGNPLVLGAGILGLYLASAGIALLFVGVLRDMGIALSLCGLYVGTALAFSGAAFPITGAPVFARVWNALLPLTAYLKLQAQQLDIGAPALDSARWLLALAAFCVVPGVLGARRLLRDAGHGQVMS